jgi:hypothetical protein
VDNFATLANFSGARYRTNIPLVKAKAKKLAAETTPGKDIDVAVAAGDNKKLHKRFSILPDGFGRVFHPTMAGHQIMARLVLYNIAKRNAEGLKEEYDDEEVTIDRDDTCPIDSDTLLMEARCTGEDGTSSALPTNVFYFESQDRGVFDGFCEEMDDKVLDNKEPQSWKVNAKGEQQKDSAKMRRTPPPNPGAHKQMINVEWAPAVMGDCKKTCREAFQGMAGSGCGRKGTCSMPFYPTFTAANRVTGGQQNIMAVQARYSTGCGTFIYEITGDDVPTKPATCTQGKVRAPKRDSDVHGKGTSIEAAYKKFCEDNDGKMLEDKTGLDRKYQRHAVSSYGVEDRASYWISASFIKGCEGKFTIKKDTCMDKFNKGLDSCDNGGFSHGYKAAEQCVEYAVDTGFELRDEGGPWNNNHMAPAYPPPEDIDEHKVV